MSVTVSLRESQAFPLSWEQVDDNFSALASAINQTNQGGTTAQRPALPALWQPYFDTSLGFPIWCSQNTPSIIWVDSAGVSV
jgi:hypothetical protein